MDANFLQAWSWTCQVALGDADIEPPLAVAIALLAWRPELPLLFRFLDAG